jgi:acyl-CoA thioesterase FadM
VAGYSETFRGDVAPWEVDATEHFTVAYYYEKFEAATWRFLRQKGVNPAAARTVDALTHYKTELRDRDIFRIETALIEGGDAPLIAHKLFNAETDELCTAMLQQLSGITLSGDTVEWDADKREERPVPVDGPNWVASQRSVVRPEEADWTGHLALSGHIRRFSTANAFIIAAFGLTPEYMTKERVGLSTFEFQLVFHNRRAVPGTLIDVDSCVAQLGGSSIRLYHRLRDGDTGEDIAGLSQFGVQLDLDARRPKRIADNLRERAQALLAAG